MPSVLVLNFLAGPTILTPPMHIGITMVINPKVEIYLLDPAGRILAYSAPPGKIKRARVDLAPVERFLARATALPILGDDPRAPDRRKVFSAAPIARDNRLQGFLYVILGGEVYEGSAEMLQGGPS